MDKVPSSRSEMAATRENVLAAIVEYVESNKRRAPAKDIALVVGDTVPNVQAIVKQLIGEGAVNSSRGRNGGALPDGVTLDKPQKAKVAKAIVEANPQPVSDEVVADQFAALMEQLGQEDNHAV